MAPNGPRRKRPPSRLSRVEREKQSIIDRVYKGRAIPLGRRNKLIERLTRLFKSQLRELAGDPRTDVLRRISRMSGAPLPHVEELVESFLAGKPARPIPSIPRIGNVYRWRADSMTPAQIQHLNRLSQFAEEYVAQIAHNVPGVVRVELAPKNNPGFDLKVYLKRAPQTPVPVEVKLSLEPLASAVIPIAVRNRELTNQGARVFAVVTLEGVALIKADRLRAYVRNALLERGLDEINRIRVLHKSAQQSGDLYHLLDAEQRLDRFLWYERKYYSKKRSIRFPLGPLLRDRWAVVRRYDSVDRRQRLTRPDFLSKSGFVLPPRANSPD